MTTRHSSASGRLTIHDVAALASVSSMTVSRALKSPERVSADTLQRVREAVARTGYVPNALAGGLRSARTGLVAALVPTLRTHLYDATIESLSAALASDGYQLLLGQTEHSPQQEEDLLRAILGRQPEGIVIAGARHSNGTRALLLSSGLPVVEINDWTQTPIDMLVGFSHEQIGNGACSYLAGKGHRRLAVISTDNERARRRAESFVTAARARRLPAPRIHFLPDPSNHAGGRAGLAALLEKSQVDAVFCGSDMIALGVLTEARARRIDVPGALAVLGSGDLEFAASMTPSLSTIRVDYERVGTVAARFIADRVARRERTDTVVDVGFSIVERESA